MIQGEFKKILFEMFDVLGFFDDEKSSALEWFKKKFAVELLNEFKENLSEDQRNWLIQAMLKDEFDKNDPTMVQIQEIINSYSDKEEFNQITRKVFKKIITDYINFMTQKVGPEKGEKLAQLLQGF